MITMQMAPTARRILEQVLGLKAGEHLALVTDTECPQTITQTLATMAQGLGAETVVVTQAPRPVGSVEPLRVVGAAMHAADAIINQASYAIVHNDTVRAALQKGVRLCDMWGFTEDMMVRGGATADYDEVKRLGERLAERLTQGREARMTTPDGTDLRVSLEGRQGYSLHGLARERGTFSAFPDGEATTSPLEGSAEGVLVGPYCIEKRELGYVTERITVHVKSGNIVKTEGGPQARMLWDILAQAGGAAFNLAEFAIGTNPKCRLGVTLREAKKAWGTAHVGVGDSRSVGGKISGPLHFDLIFLRPTVTVDGQALVKDGQVVA